MELVTRKSECKRLVDSSMLIKSKKEITKKMTKATSPKYCIIVKPFHSSFLPYKQIVFRGVTFSDDFSIELIRNADDVIAHQEHTQINDSLTNVFHTSGQAIFKVMN